MADELVSTLTDPSNPVQVVPVALVVISNRVSADKTTSYKYVQLPPVIPNLYNPSDKFVKE